MNESKHYIDVYKFIVYSSEITGIHSLWHLIIMSYSISEMKKKRQSQKIHSIGSENVNSEPICGEKKMDKNFIVNGMNSSTAVIASWNVNWCALFQ